LIRLALRCRRVDAEAALAELLELAPGGVEEVDEPGGEPGVVEYAIYGAAGELPDLGVLRAAAGRALVEVRSEPVPDDWAERWKRFYYPLLIAGRLYVRPPWERPAERGGVVEVVIDPGRAFGTGTHATTSMCLELLLGTRARRGALAFLGRGDARSVCDLGCGSGVLAIAASKLGFDPVLGVDLEQAAIEESARNAGLNYVELELRQVDLRREAPVADVVTANLTAALLEQVAARWAADEERPETLIASGFLSGEAGKVSQMLAAAGLHEHQHLMNGDWGALIAHRS
jgi:ribosomal protein L11 methyltransferase